MSVRNGEQIAEFIENVVHAGTQVRERQFDLTVNRIDHLTGPGQLDFGGSEFARAERTAVASRKKDPDDEYGWWLLEEGTYVIEYNEGIDVTDGPSALVFPLDRLLQAGAAHSSFLVTDHKETPETQLTVGPGGCHIKENARVSGVVLLD